MKVVDYERTIQRLMNAASSDRMILLRTLLDGKSADAIRQVTTALVTLIDKRTLDLEGEKIVLTVLLEASSQDVGLATSLRCTIFPGIAKRLLAVSDRLGEKIGFEAALAHLDELCRMQDGAVAVWCRAQILESVTDRLVQGWGRLREVVQVLDWTGAFRPAIRAWDEAKDAFSPSTQSPMLLGLALLTAKACERTGKLGIAAGIYTTLGRQVSELIPLYRQAQRCGQVIRPDWFGYLSTTPSSEHGDALLKRVFGEEPAQHPAFRRRDERQDGYSYQVDAEGVITVNDPFAMAVVERLLAHGAWASAHHLFAHPGVQALRRLYNIGGLVIPAMQLAGRQGRIGVAAALGQFALAHSDGLIGCIAKQLAADKFDEPLGVVGRALYVAQAPWIPAPEWEGGMYEPARPPPLDLKRREDDLRAQQTAFAINLRAALTQEAQRYLDEAIRANQPLVWNAG
jgi:hypothetical protein